MNISRRHFVGTASRAVAVAFCSFPSLRFEPSDSRSKRGMHCSLLDLESRCVLPESFQGYQLALGSEHHYLSEAGLDSLYSHHLFIVPAAGTVNPATIRALSDLLDTGTSVLWESGAAFLNPADFEAHRAMLDEHFAITIDRPIELWSSNQPELSLADRARGSRNRKQTGHESVPYVTYNWPLETRVRDFNRAIPVSSKDGLAIANLGDLPVALSKRIGKGTFIFLGSPIGPAIRAGDSEARSWLRSVIADAV
jgi:hypothetical protein